MLFNSFIFNFKREVNANAMEDVVKSVLVISARLWRKLLNCESVNWKSPNFETSVSTIEPRELLYYHQHYIYLFYQTLHVSVL